MSLFQASVTNKYLKTLDKQVIQAAYARFKMHFHNATIQENIRTSKEEQYQGEFLIDLFVNVLGYVKNPTPNYNLTTEYKNVKDSKKADGAIVIGNVVKAVIELKGTNTTDLGNVEAQAFGYKNNQPQCVYVVTSNFEKLRFYIDNAIEHLEFNLFTLTEKEFEKLYLCLAFTSIENDLPKKIKEESISQEDKVTKELYNDYSLFKRELHQNLVALNPEYDALLLFKKSQKLLDRYLFLFFAEDRQLLPPNSVRMILTQWQELRDLDEYSPLYSRFKKYFGYLNTGFKGKKFDVFAYNGGLFKPDDVLDNVKIDDELLYKHTLKLSEYDFESEVDVNILGHIFENSLNELDEVKAQLSGAEVDKTKTRRKKDGVFYTPKYITKYIVDNTVGKLCADKKAELGIIEEDYFSDKKRNKTTKQPLADKLNAYREWLLQITICDPACGSGAFLNQALNFLIDEHRTIDEMQAKLFGDTLVLSDIENTILENNLFGVDLNEESVEIAKLSLWLRTAQPNRKLNDLSNNIKCGNSLIDDPAVAGEKAFNWEQEFPQVFTDAKEISPIVKPEIDETPDYLKLIKEKSLEAQAKAEQAIALSKEAAEISKRVYEYATKLGSVSDSDSPYGIRRGGFDVVIGNPPYAGRSSSIDDNEKSFIRNTFISSEGKFELYQLFIERCYNLTKNSNAYVSLITPQTWLSIIQATKLRKLILDKTELTEVVFLGKNIFEDASVDSIIFFINKGAHKDIIRFYNSKNILENVLDYEVIVYSDIDKNDLVIPINSNSDIFKTITKIRTNTIDTESIGEWSDGIKIVGNAKDYAFQKLKLNETFFPILFGKDINKYSLNWSGIYCCRDKSKIEEHNATDIRLRDDKMFLRNKILIRKTGDEIVATLDKKMFFYEQSLFSFGLDSLNFDLKYILVILNSKISNFLLHANAFSKKETFPQIRLHWLKQLPIKVLSLTDQQPFILKADLMLSLNKELQEVSGKFQRSVMRKFALEDLPGKLQNWYQLTYAEFIAELGKKKLKLSLNDEAEWESYFEQEADKALAIKTQLETTDREIDQLVYALYGLTAEEISIVETK